MELIRYEAARQAHAEAHAVDEVKAIHDKAVALKAYAQQANDESLLMLAAEIKLRAERKAGELLKEMERHQPEDGRPAEKGSPGVTLSDKPKLKDLGITKNQSAKWQKLATVDPEDFEAYVTQPKPTTKGASLRLTNALSLTIPPWAP